MAIQSAPIWDESYLTSTSAGSGLTQFTFCALSTALGTAGLGASGLPIVMQCAGASNGINGPFGIVQDAPAAGGRAALVRKFGTSKVVATTSAAVTFGALLTSNATGQAMVADTTGQLVMGRCIAASTTLVSGALAEIEMYGPFTWFA